MTEPGTPADTPRGALPGTPQGPIEKIVMGGILEWRGGDAAQLQGIVAQINGLGLPRAELDADGGRWSLLFDDAPAAGRDLKPGALEDFAQYLQDLVDAADDRDSAESTLHCSAFYRDEVVETLIGVEAGNLRPLSRIAKRSRSAKPIQAQRYAWGKLIPMGLLLLLGFGLMAWRSGYIDRVFAASSTDLALDNAAFGDRLTLVVDRSWGEYHVTITRGPTYPDSIEKLEAQRSQATTISDRAALGILADGEAIYVRLLDADQKILAANSTDLRALVESKDGKAKVKLPGRMGAARIQLALSRGS